MERGKEGRERNDSKSLEDFAERNERLSVGKIGKTVRRRREKEEKGREEKGLE